MLWMISPSSVDRIDLDVDVVSIRLNRCSLRSYTCSLDSYSVANPLIWILVVISIVPEDEWTVMVEIMVESLLFDMGADWRKVWFHDASTDRKWFGVLLLQVFDDDKLPGFPSVGWVSGEVGYYGEHGCVQLIRNCVQKCCFCIFIVITVSWRCRFTDNNILSVFLAFGFYHVFWAFLNTMVFMFVFAVYNRSVTYLTSSIWSYNDIF